MSVPSPLRSIHQSLGALSSLYGPADLAIELPLVYGPVELEYAAIRRGAGVFDAAHLAVVEVTGVDRLAFLERMLTQRLAGMSEGESRSSFWLNRKGRIDADVRVLHLPDRTLLLLDALSLARTMESLPGFVFTEDVAFRDASAQLHALGLHGRRATEFLAIASDKSFPSDGSIPENRLLRTHVADRPAIVDRHDLAAEPGFTILASPEHVAEIFESLTGALSGDERHPERARPIGWHALNVARIEAGTPLYNVDFGPDSLPAETGVLDDRVSFVKGCYLGQEIVARMKSLGHPRQCLVGLRLDDKESVDSQPETGATVHPTADAQAPPIGAITSSCVSPMLGGSCICFAMIKWGHHAPGTSVYVERSGQSTHATVQDSLRFWSPGS